MGYSPTDHCLDYLCQIIIDKDINWIELRKWFLLWKTKEIDPTWKFIMSQYDVCLGNVTNVNIIHIEFEHIIFLIYIQISIYSYLIHDYFSFVKGQITFLRVFPESDVLLSIFFKYTDDSQHKEETTYSFGRMYKLIWNLKKENC